MTAPVENALYLASGTTGTSHTAASRRFRGFTPGQAFYIGALYKATRTTGSGILNLKIRAQWKNAADANLTPTDTEVSINATVTDFTFVEKRHIAPAGAVSCELQVVATPAASPMEHNLWVGVPRCSRNEAGADITSVVDGPSTATFAHDHLGVAEDGEFPRALPFKLLAAGGTVTSGITWTYTVLTGEVNGFDNADGAQSISGSGSVNFTVSSLSTNTATVEVKATYGGVARTKVVTLSKAFAAPPTSGGGGSSTASQTSGFSPINSSSFAAISDVLETTLGTGKTQINVNISLSVGSVAVAPTGGNNIEFKVQRDVSGTWTDIGSVQNSAPDPVVGYDSETMEYYPLSTGTMSATINDTGLTAGNTYSHRVVARYSSGSSNHAPFPVTGTISTAVP